MSSVDRTFHEGELAVQARAGVRDLADRGRPGIRSAMPDQHRELFEKLPYLVIGAIDPAGRPFATVLANEPGFVETRDPFTLVVDALPRAGDPIAACLRVGAPIGILGIELGTRRRNRVNGTLREVARRLVVDVEQSFGNCPRYIQARRVVAVDRPRGAASPEAAALSSRARDILARADTAFLASVAGTVARDGVHGCDVSHRGGKPGFLKVEDGPGGVVVTMPDFAGNNFFMTLGNIAVAPAVGLAVLDFESGALLSLTGSATIVWEGEELERFVGAERLVRIVVEGGALLDGAIPFRFGEPAPWPRLAETGSW